MMEAAMSVNGSGELNMTNGTNCTFGGANHTVGGKGFASEARVALVAGGSLQVDALLRAPAPPHAASVGARNCAEAPHGFAHGVP